MKQVLVVASLAATLTLSCARLDQPPVGEAETPKLPEQEFYDATITFYQNNRLSAVLKAGRIRKFEKQSVVLLDSGVVTDFYDIQGKRTTTLWSDSARADENRKDMIAQGNVVAKSDSGETLESDELRWDNRTRRIISNTRVKLSTPTDTIYGIGFTSDEHLRNWQIDHPQGKTFRELERRVKPDSLLPNPLTPQSDVE